MGSEYLWDMPADIPFGFGPPGGEVPDPNDPRQMQQFLSQLQQLFATPGGGPVNWDLARQLAQAHLTGTGPEGAVSQFPVGFAMPGTPLPTADPSDPDAAKPVGDPAVTAAERAAVIEALH